MKKIKSILVVLIVLTSFCMAAPVLASPTALGTPDVAVYDQQDWPVFIGYSAGTNQGFLCTDYAGGDEGEFTSPTYTGTVLTDLIDMVGTTPLIAIDINQVGKPGSDAQQYQINYLDAWIDYGAGFVDAYRYTGVLSQQETGNGDSDWVIPGLDLTGAQSLYFVLDFGNRNEGEVIGDNNDGKENFFLVKAGAPEVPIPAAVWLLGAGLMGLVGLRRRKNI
jgi:hypothetical protein